MGGPELDPANPPQPPHTGTATYVAGMGGPYTYHYGGAWGELAESGEVTEFAGAVSLTAAFDRNRLTGCLGCLASSMASSLCVALIPNDVPSDT